MIQITDLTDPRVADYTHVGDPGWLAARGLFVAEGRLVVRRLFQSNSFTIQSVLVTSQARAALDDAVDASRCPIFVCPPLLLNELAGFNFHRGCLALARRPPLVDSPDPFVESRRLLALEGIGNPDNVGGLFRVAAAFDSEAVLLDRTSGDPLYRKAIRTSMGAIFRVPFAKIDRWLAAIETFRGRGADVIAMTPDRSAIPLVDYAKDLPRNRQVVIMLGAEGPGLSADARSLATAAVRIPISSSVDSLNVVVAAGIALAALPR